MNIYQWQAHGARNTPGLSIDDGRFIDRWEQNAPRVDEAMTRTWVGERRARDEAKTRNVLQRLDKLQDDLVDIRKRAERNELPWRDLAKAQRKAARERQTLEEVYKSLVSSEQRIGEIEADPVTYMEQMYRRFPQLADRRPNLARDLAEDQRKRGIRQAFNL